MRRVHRMPFGAETDAGGTRFRLWAPGARRVALWLESPGAPRALAMPDRGDGWHELHVEAVGAGAHYRFELDGEVRVPDPASRFQAGGVPGASVVVDPTAHEWRDAGWHGRPWHEAVIYELHVGAFGPEGGYAGVRERLDHLVELGVTAIELMPLADCPGARNWGYDGVLLFAPAARFGAPEQLKALVEAAHARGLMVLLDVVYNHFGPEGNFLPRLAPAFFTRRHHTPWGAAIDFDGPESRNVRDFFIHNALYWLEEYHLDGLRVDAVHAIHDGSQPHIVEELSARVRARFESERHVHLVLENDRNQASLLTGPAACTAQWDDDAHHAFHVLLTGERDGYYADYAGAPARHLARCLVEGLAWQGEASPFRGGAARGEPSAHLPPTCFVAFLQNHDQVGNRPFGERLTRLASPAALDAAAAVLLLAPWIPLLFMGEEWGADEPFLFFCDFGGELGRSVREGRRQEFAHFPAFRDEAARERIPDPEDPRTFEASRLRWESLGHAPHAARLDLYRRLLALRQREIAPRLAGLPAGGEAEAFGRSGVRAGWRLGDGSLLSLVTWLGAQPAAAVPARPPGRALAAVPAECADALSAGQLPAWSACWFLAERDGA